MQIVAAIVIAITLGSMPATDADSEDALPGTPIVIDLDGDGIHLSGPDQAVFFDLDADGEKDAIAWTALGELDGLLAIDIDGNGWIDSGRELFGDNSLMLDGKPAPNGFVALSVYDGEKSGGNEDGLIDPNDLVFDALRIWVDGNHNGISDEGELLTLTEASISYLDLAFVENRRRDRQGNLFLHHGNAWILLNDGTQAPRQMSDVIFRLAE